MTLGRRCGLRAGRPTPVCIPSARTEPSTSAQVALCRRSFPLPPAASSRKRAQSGRGALALFLVHLLPEGLFHRFFPPVLEVLDRRRRIPFMRQHAPAPVKHEVACVVGVARTPAMNRHAQGQSAVQVGHSGLGPNRGVSRPVYLLSLSSAGLEGSSPTLNGRVSRAAHPGILASRCTSHRRRGCQSIYLHQA
jgi:hypothetical protein